ncbi:response regulator transcription factor [Cytobacillus depressus]|uniref:Response regulator transcription factor n=1 Tax=Cytobacillus depressus TaxID=1602942 RepID=A0A6L3V765_9BACI|nr:response regulator transcription factor [Cytobacillus depressus]KAB2336322.1 response regulator transcription factor [Cytobacillus depressus]
MIRIVIAEDVEMLLGVLGSHLNLESDMEVVGQARNGEEALALVQKLKPDVCIMDIDMSEMSRLETVDAFMLTGCKVIILTTFARTGYFEKALKAGVKGYLLKDSPSEELISSIRRIMKGAQIYSSELMDKDSFENEHGIEMFEWCAAGQIINEASNQKSNKMVSVRSFFSTIMDKMKLPTG